MGQKKEQVNRCEERIDCQRHQEKTGCNQPTVPKATGHAVPEHFTFGENLNIRHQIVIGADCTPAMAAKPCARRLRGGAMMANLLRLRLLQFLFELGIPRIRGGWRVANPDDQPPQTGKNQTADGNLGNNHVWIAGGKHKQLPHSHISFPAGQADKRIAGVLILIVILILISSGT